MSELQTTVEKYESAIKAAELTWQLLKHDMKHGELFDKYISELRTCQELQNEIKP